MTYVLCIEELLYIMLMILIHVHVNVPGADTEFI